MAGLPSEKTVSDEATSATVSSLPCGNLPKPFSKGDQKKMSS